MDLAAVGLDGIQYVRVRQPADATWSTEIDAFADVAAVPEPNMWLLGSGVAIVWGAGRLSCRSIR